MDESPIDRIIQLSDKLPYEIFADVRGRMDDWMLAGGHQSDPYMWRQVKFAERYIKMNPIK
ncbi:hypothetical protein M5C72_07165 [Companilactobacillus allii]|uniref:DUF6877 domain-containing protein n=1 Tax=Companilactobacillus allii TaxID=1847728 RepID=A0A1P8Q4T8_9LACO|nr:DUF6877 family protein [Companilactobacillus allii]APX72877.1 hypothetical protein BTM29_10080 [Companilactobacillus allii]USQ67665.1 hypothetical protein M5C72_07165 [Companilactobacillus allii]